MGFQRLKDRVAHTDEAYDHVQNKYHELRVQVAALCAAIDAVKAETRAPINKPLREAIDRLCEERAKIK
jgi:uncharacterized coiled-coil DUF342 family protein